MMSIVPKPTPDSGLMERIAVARLPDNLVSHRASWLKALERLIELEPESHGPDMDEKGYWRHELKAMVDMYADLDHLALAPAPTSSTLQSKDEQIERLTRERDEWIERCRAALIAFDEQKARAEAAELVKPITEGYVRKGGVNNTPSKVTERPAPPIPMNLTNPKTKGYRQDLWTYPVLLTKEELWEAINLIGASYVPGPGNEVAERLSAKLSKAYNRAT